MALSFYGILVQVPRPERYGIHTLIVAQRRPKHHGSPWAVTPESLLREARRQKWVAIDPVPHFRLFESGRQYSPSTSL